MNVSSNKKHCVIFLKIRFIILRSKDSTFFLWQLDIDLIVVINALKPNYKGFCFLSLFG